MLDKNKAFTGEYSFLSNMTYVKVVYDEVEYPSTENAFQAAKLESKEARLPYQSCKPFTAKQFSRNAKPREGWNELRDIVMESLLRQKFQRADLKAKLLATGDMELVEYNYWHDNYWGSCTCPRCCNNGQNKLGKLLMQIREELK